MSALTGCTASSLTSCLNDLLALFTEAASSPHPAIREKYSKDKYAVEPCLFVTVLVETKYSVAHFSVRSVALLKWLQPVISQLIAGI